MMACTPRLFSAVKLENKMKVGRQSGVHLGNLFRLVQGREDDKVILDRLLETLPRWTDE